MKVDRNELMTAAQLAAVVASDHTIQAFTKVWVLNGKVSAFNGQIGLIVPLEDLPDVGGIDGKALANLLARSEEDEVSLTVTSDKGLQLKGIDARIRFNIMDPGSYIEAEPKGKAEKLFEIPIAAFDDIQLDAMAGIKEAKGEAAPEFLSVSLHPHGKRFVAVFSSDRYTLNRSLWEVDCMLPGAVYIPLDFFRLFKRLRGEFENGVLRVTDRYAMILADEEDKNCSRLFCKLMHPSDTPADFYGIINRIWPEGEQDKKLLVPIPEELITAVDRADVLADKANNLGLHIAGKRMTITLDSKTGTFTTEFKLQKTHPDVQATVNIDLFKRALPHVDRMYIGRLAMALFGPLRYSTYISISPIAQQSAAIDDDEIPF